MAAPVAPVTEVLKPRAPGAGAPKSSEKELRKLRTWSLDTPKFHSLGDAVPYIRRFGTTDSYSTQLVSVLRLLSYCDMILTIFVRQSERAHRFSKARYTRTNKKDVERQLSAIQTRTARIKRLRKQLASPAEEDGGKRGRLAASRELDKPYVVAKSQNQPVPLSDFLRLHADDMAIKVRY